MKWTVRYTSERKYLISAFVGGQRGLVTTQVIDQNYTLKDIHLRAVYFSPSNGAILTECQFHSCTCYHEKQNAGTTVHYPTLSNFGDTNPRTAYHNHTKEPHQPGLLLAARSALDSDFGLSKRLDLALVIADHSDLRSSE